MAQEVEISEPVASLLNMREQFQADLRHLLEAPQAQFVEVLSRELDLLAAPEPASSKMQTVASEIGVDTTALEAVRRVLLWLSRAVPPSEIQDIVDDLQRADFVSSDEVAALVDLFDKLFGVFRSAQERRASLCAIMQTFLGIRYVCDLRLGTDAGSAPNATSTPVSIVRIYTDEGDPTIFQCTVVDLDRMIEALSDARKVLTESILSNPAIQK
jgi:hypothetical protein